MTKCEALRLLIAGMESRLADEPTGASREMREAIATISAQPPSSLAKPPPPPSLWEKYADEKMAVVDMSGKAYPVPKRTCADLLTTLLTTLLVTLLATRRVNPSWYTVQLPPRPPELPTARLGWNILSVEHLLYRRCVRRLYKRVM